MQSFLRPLARVWVRYIHPRLAPFVAVVGTVWLGVCLIILYGLAQLSDEVIEREAFPFDAPTLLWLHQFSNPALDSVMLAFTQLGNPSTVVPLTIAIVVLLWWRRHYLVAKMFAINCLGGAILSTGLKLAFGKDRPQLWLQHITETTHSFPSGHALGSTVLYGFLAYLLAQRYPQWSGLIYTLTALLIGTIGLSRLYLGVHWPTDVMAGYGVGLLWLTVCVALLRLQQSKLKASR